MQNKLSLTLISLLANFIIAGFASQFGMLTDPIAKVFQVNIEDITSIFSLLNGGALAGTVLAFFLIDIVGAKKITLASFIMIFICAIAMHCTNSLWIINVSMTLIGLAGGIGLCIAGTIIVSVWENRLQSTIYVVQDATFNISGVIFSLITTAVLFYNLKWSTSYLIIGIIAILMVIIVALTNFNVIDSANLNNTKSAKSEWNFGLFSAGISLFLAMVALYTFLTWAPIFVSEKFVISFENSSNIITQYWSAALVGAITSTIIVSKVKIQNFFITIIGLAMIITTLIMTTKQLSNIAYFSYGYGFVCASLYNASIAYGVTFVKQASSKNVSFILFSGSTGAMFGPVISSQLHKIYNTQIVMNIIPILYLVILILLIVSFAAQGKLKKQFQRLPQL